MSNILQSRGTSVEQEYTHEYACALDGRNGPLEQNR